MVRYRVVVSYDGFNYSGWQKQSKSISIQETIEDILYKITKEKIKIVASGRTDAKVSALGQVFHFDTYKVMEDKKWKYALNNYLPKDIYVKSINQVSNNFHSRLWVISKTYEYRINFKEYDVFNRNREAYLYYELDVSKMIEASKLFLGEHDFTSFNSSPLNKYPNQVRYIFEIDFSYDEILKIRFKGNGFLRYMVRMLVACLIEVGRGRLSIDEVKSILDKKEKNSFNRNAPANGLCLLEVKHFNLIELNDLELVRDLYEEDKIYYSIKEDINLYYGIFERKSNILKELRRK